MTVIDLKVIKKTISRNLIYLVTYRRDELDVSREICAKLCKIDARAKVECSAKRCRYKVLAFFVFVFAFIKLIFFTKS